MKYFKKKHVNLLKNKSGKSKNFHICYGIYALQAIESGILTENNIECARRVFVRITQRKSKLWLRCKVNIPLTAKPREIRMGKGKGEVSQYVRYITRGTIFFETISSKLSISALLALKKKLPIKTKIISNL